MTIPAIIGHFPYLGLFALLILGGFGLPFPEDTTLILCGFLIATDVIRPLPALATIYTGILLADYGLYSVGSRYGSLVVSHRRFRKVLTPERLSALQETFKRWGVLVILIGRHLIGLRAQIFIVSGVMRMNPLKFLVADALSSLVTIALMVGAGYVGGNSLEVIKKDMRRIEHFAILLGVVSLAVFLLLRYLAMRRRGQKSEL